jgi:hypothetical protein
MIETRKAANFLVTLALPRAGEVPTMPAKSSLA